MCLVLSRQLNTVCLLLMTMWWFEAPESLLQEVWPQKEMADVVCISSILSLRGDSSLLPASFYQRVSTSRVSLQFRKGKCSLVCMLWEAAVVQLEVKRTEAGMAGLWFSELCPSEVTDELLLHQKPLH